MRYSMCFIAEFFGLALLLGTYDACAIAPRYVSDDELATYPIIVVAKWDKAPATWPRRCDTCWGPTPA